MDISGLGPTTATTAPNQAADKDKQANFHDYMLAAAQSGKTSDVDPEEVSETQKLYDDILATGFSKWVQDMREEELEKKIRERVLASMGITEDQLADMPAEQKAAIEKIIQDYIQQALAEKGQDKAKEMQNKGQAYVPVLPGAL